MNNQQDEVKQRADRIRALSDGDLVQVYELFKVALNLRFLSIVATVEPPPVSPDAAR